MSPEDTLRALLREAAEDAPAYESVDVGSATKATALRRWAPLGVVAAVVVVIAAGGFVVSRTGGGRDVSPPVSTSTIPSQPTPTGLSSDGNRADAARCPAADFRVAWLIDNVGAGTTTDWFTVTNTSSTPCAVDAVGPRQIEGVTADGETQEVQVQATRAGDVGLNPVHRLAPGQSGRFMVGTGAAANCDTPETGAYDALRLDLGAAEPLVADFTGSSFGSFAPGCGPWVSGVGLAPSPSTLPCGAWMAPSTELYQAIVRGYGEIDDCGAIDGTWIVDTDEGTRAVGSVGVHVCDGRCEDDPPATLGDWTFYHVAQKKGTNERLSGVDDGRIRFVGAVGEVHFDPATGTWDVPVTEASPRG